MSDDHWYVKTYLTKTLKIYLDEWYEIPFLQYIVFSLVFFCWYYEKFSVRTDKRKIYGFQNSKQIRTNWFNRHSERCWRNIYLFDRKINLLNIGCNMLCSWNIETIWNMCRTAFIFSGVQLLRISTEKTFFLVSLTILNLWGAPP